MKSNVFSSHRKSPSMESPNSYLLINNLLNINYKISVPGHEQAANAKLENNGSVTDRSNQSGNKSGISRRHNLEPKEKPSASRLFTSHKKSNSFASKVSKPAEKPANNHSPTWNFLEEAISKGKKKGEDKAVASKKPFHKENLLSSIKSNLGQKAKTPLTQRPKSKEGNFHNSSKLIGSKKGADPSPISKLMRELNSKSFMQKSSAKPLSKQPSKEGGAKRTFNLGKRTGSLDLGKATNSSFTEIKSFDLNSQRKIRYSSRTRQGYLASYVGKVNQDAIISLPNLFKKADIHLFAVADGHGVNGHLVSNFVLYHLSDILSKDRELIVSPRKALMKAFHSVAKSLAESSIDSSLSGTTVNVVLINGPKVYCANCGDSRAIMAKRTKQKWDLVPLSRDHKPTSEGEYERIKLMGGRVEPIMESDGSYVGPSRVWLMEDNLPGLAMSRSFGDYIAGQVGVIPEPEIIEAKIDADCKFIFLASDGVWENIESGECIKMLAPFYEINNIESGCDYMMEESYNKWIEDDDEVIDDISFISVFL